MLKITMLMMVTMMWIRVWLAWREPPAACHCFFTTWEAAADETTQSRDTSQCEIDKVYLHQAREAICQHLNPISNSFCWRSSNVGHESPRTTNCSGNRGQRHEKQSRWPTNDKVKNQVDLGGQRADGGIEVTDRRLGEGSCGGAPLSEAFFIVVRKRPTSYFFLQHFVNVVQA